MTGRDVGGLDALIGESAAIVALRRQVQSLLQRPSTLRRLPPILIQGETGTGKTMLARLIHRASPRANGPFVDISCAAIPETMLEAELFGYERGAFTDAKQAKPGLFQLADGGVLFLDEIGIMPLLLQAKLLKALDEGVVRRLGATRSETVNAAIVAATNEDLLTAIREKRFREDLYNRIAVITLELPPLRERDDDIERLAERFLARACADYGLAPKLLNDDARAALREYSWPGNVRELGNVLERVALLSESRAVTAATLGLPASPVAVEAIEVEEASDDTGRTKLVRALERTGGNITQTARLLRITRNTVRARMQRYGLRQDTGETPPSAERSTVPLREPARVPDVAPPDAAHTAGAGIRWDRRRVAYLSARLPADEPGPSRSTARLLDLVVDKVQSFGGRVEDVSPHAAFAVFGLEPIEDAPRRAANAAIAIMKSAERERREDAGPSDVSLAIGLHVSRPLVARIAGVPQIDRDAKRDAWSVLDGLGAASGEIVVSESVVPFVERHFEIVRLARGAHVVHRLGGRDASAGTGDATPFVGRERESELLQRLLDRAARHQGQVITVVGQPGIGKSRLIREFRQTLAEQPVTVLEGRCVPYGTHVPYLPVLDILHAVCGVQETDPLPVVDAKVQAVLDRFGTAAAGWAPYLRNLVHPRKDADVSGRAPEAVKGRTFEALQQLMVGQQDRQPVVLVIEDLQWIDTTSAELLASLAARLAGLRVLFIGTCRPGHSAPWTGHSYATQVGLLPLSAADGRRLVTSVVGAAPPPDAVVATILERAEGNPFFLEELARAVRDKTPISGVRVPDTVHDVIAARTDRLPDADRRALQAAAVIGRDVAFPLLAAIGDLPDTELRAILGRLQAGEFLYTTHLAPQPEYAFRHALIHDVVYDGIPEAERRAWHERVAQAIDALIPETKERRPETLARHYTEAHRPIEAIEHWQRAAQLAVQRSAHVDALAHGAQALALIEAQPDDAARAAQEVSVQLSLAMSLTATRGFAAPELEHTLARVRALTDRLVDPARRFFVGWSLWRFHFSRAEFRTAEELAAELLAIAEGQDDPVARVGAVLAAGIDTFYLAEFATARGHLERAAGLYDHAQASTYTSRYGQDLGLAALGFLGWTEAVTGDLDAAVAHVRDGLRLAGDIRHPFSLATALLLACEVHELLRDPVTVGPLGEELVTLAREHSFTFFSAIGLMHSGWARAAGGDLPDGITVMRQGAELFRSVGQRAGLAHRARLAEALLDAGDVAGALDVIADALRESEVTDQHAYVSELLRLRGVALARRGDAAGARRWLGDALDRARRQGAWLLALRAAYSLAQFDPHTVETLRDVAGRFPATLDSGDLRTARALLEAPR